jgi:hypothetical protein
MKDSRAGQSLWSEWDGLGYEEGSNFDVIFFTEDHVTLEEDVVSRALASCLQRDGIADSLSDGFKMISSSVISNGYAGYVDSDSIYVVCDSEGMTEDGEFVDEIIKITWVEV